MNGKICKSCGADDPSLFRKGRNRCKKCDYALNKDRNNERSKRYYKDNKDKIKLDNIERKEEIVAKRKIRYQEHKDTIKCKVKQYREANKEKVKGFVSKYYNDNRDAILAYHKEYRAKHKLKIAEKKKCYEASRMTTDPAFRLRRSVRNAVYCAILRTGSKKNGSILEHLPYSMDDLKAHLESMFEPWMNWDNWGVYNPAEWDDEDPSTWTWNIDHIIRQADLEYDSFTHQNFHKCWALNNLRPYSSKMNVIENNRREI
ncbi:hypothetical protein M0R72_01990 [Candidatus Pacearchaeota archaeon]|jgi:hypothetical protein|nr:hypothetical protein [Candidatus Pacearchaeota archaeon]